LIFTCTVCFRTFPVASVAESHCAEWKDQGTDEPAGASDE
jgi:hypothetical protein